MVAKFSLPAKLAFTGARGTLPQLCMVLTSINLLTFTTQPPVFPLESSGCVSSDSPVVIQLQFVSRHPGAAVSLHSNSSMPSRVRSLVLCMIPHSALSSLPSRYVLALDTQALCGVGCSPGAVQSPSWVLAPGWTRSQTQEPLPHQPQSPYTPPQPPSTKLLAQGFIESLPAPCLCSRF